MTGPEMLLKSFGIDPGEIKEAGQRAYALLGEVVETLRRLEVKVDTLLLHATEPAVDLTTANHFAELERDNAQT